MLHRGPEWRWGREMLAKLRRCRCACPTVSSGSQVAEVSGHAGKRAPRTGFIAALGAGPS